jgi:hypothetical protein
VDPMNDHRSFTLPRSKVHGLRQGVAAYTTLAGECATERRTEVSSIQCTAGTA